MLHINFFVYFVYLYLIYWKSITYQETITCLSLFILFLLKNFFFIARMPFCQFLIKSKGLNWYLRECMRERKFMSLWALLILILWFGGNLREWFEAKKFFCLWTWLYILYIGGTPAPRQGPNSHQHVLTIGLRASKPAC